MQNESCIIESFLSLILKFEKNILIIKLQNLLRYCLIEYLTKCVFTYTLKFNVSVLYSKVLL